MWKHKLLTYPQGSNEDEVNVNANVQQKNRKRSEPSNYNTRPVQRYQNIALPEVITIDALGTMLDEDLIVRLRTLDEDKNKAYDSHVDARPWEEEIAYIRREQQLRRVRRDSHQEYVRKSELEFNLSERYLEAGDFDNSAFVYASSGGRPRWN